MTKRKSPIILFLTLSASLFLGLLTENLAAQNSKTEETEQKKKSEKESKAKNRQIKKNQEKQQKSKLDKKSKGAGKENDKKGSKEEKDLTLKNLFPEKSPFGPSASRTAFSYEGQYAAFLYRPYIERRHGNDLFVYDFKNDEMKRLTSVSVMAEFQASTRKVQKDRTEKAKKAQKAIADKESQNEKEKKDKDSKAKSNEKDDSDKSKIKENSEKKSDKKFGDVVSDKDADDEKAPRYGGIQSFTWHPTENEILFTSGGDIYHLKLDGTAPRRLTRTQDSERSVQYLPDGKGFMFMQGDKLIRVRDGQSLIEQISPKFGQEESMSSFRLSPDGSRLAVQTRKGKNPFSSNRKVKIVNYRGRFAEVREFNRTVSDDPVVEQEVFVYFYDLSKHQNEEAELQLVHKTKLNSPRDAVSAPEWSLDSKNITFATFHFEDEHVSLFTAKFPEPKEDESKNNPEKDSNDSSQKPEGDKNSKKDSTTADKDQEELAKLQYRFLHFGGPNTPRLIQPRFLKDNTKILFVSEQTGFRHLHILDTIYQTVTPLTQGNYEVYLDDVSRDRRFALVTSTKASPARTMAYSINLETKEMKALTEVKGNYADISISQDGAKMLGNYSTFGKLKELVRVDQNRRKKAFKVLTDSHSSEAKEITKPKPEFFTYKNRHGQRLHGTVFKPQGWKKSDKRPCLIYVYGGPLGTRHMVVDGSYSSDSYFFAYYMAQVHGYVTVTIDPRGQSGYGALFEKSNYKQVGKPQVEDLVDGSRFLVENYGVDAKKIGLHGWSFGGFQTQMCLYTEPDVFAVGIAGAGPTEWENYNKWYSTGTIDRSKPGKLDQKVYSLLPLAKNLKAKLLLVHGMEDSNVLYQDTVRVYRELIKAGKETLVELFLDPTGGHGLGGDIKRLGKYRKYEEFLVRTLGSLKKTKAEEEGPKSKPFGDKPHAIPGIIEAEHYDEGPAGTAYHDNDEENQGADYRKNTQVDIEKRSDASNGHGIGWTLKGEWLHYTVKVAEDGIYKVTMPVASDKKGGSFHLEIAGEDLTGPIQVPDTGGWTILRTITHKGIKLKKGIHTIRVVMDEEGPSNSIGDIDYFEFSLMNKSERFFD